MRTLTTTTQGDTLRQSNLETKMPQYQTTNTQKKWRECFNGAAIDTSKWIETLGTGMTNTVSGGTLTFASGTTASAVGTIVSKEVFDVPARFSFGLTLSQRIANQTLVVEFVSCDPATGVIDANNVMSFVFDGTTATNAKYRVKNGSGTALDSSSVTVVTTAGGGVYEVEAFSDEVWFHSESADATVGRSNSYRRNSICPDPTASYRIRISWINGATAPASSTNAVFRFISAVDFLETNAEITSGRGNSAAGQGIAVNITSGSVGVTGTPNVVGAAAHDAAISANPVRIGARAINASYAAVSNGDVADIITTLDGRLVTNPLAIPQNTWLYAAASGGIVNTTDVAVKAAAAAGISNYVSAIQLRNNNAVATEFVIKDGSTVIWRTGLPASMAGSMDFTFTPPLRGTAATAVNVACITTGAAVYANVQGYIAP